MMNPFNQTLHFLEENLAQRVLRGLSKEDGLKNGNGCIMLKRQTQFFALSAAKPGWWGYCMAAVTVPLPREGFATGKREKFAQHELSDLHSNSLRALAMLKATPISAMLSEAAAQDQNTARTVLELLFRSIKVLGRQNATQGTQSSRWRALAAHVEEDTLTTESQRMAFTQRQLDVRYNPKRKS